MAGGIVTGGGFVGMDYMDYYGLNEIDPKGMTDAAEKGEELDKAFQNIKKTIDSIELEEDDVNEEMVANVAEDALYDIAEELYEDLGSIDEVLEYIKNTLPSIKQNLGLKYGDY